MLQIASTLLIIGIQFAGVMFSLTQQFWKGNLGWEWEIEETKLDTEK